MVGAALMIASQPIGVFPPQAVGAAFGVSFDAVGADHVSASMLPNSTSNPAGRSMSQVLAALHDVISGGRGRITGFPPFDESPSTRKVMVWAPMAALYSVPLRSEEHTAEPP